MSTEINDSWLFYFCCMQCIVGNDDSALLALWRWLFVRMNLINPLIDNYADHRQTKYVRVIHDLINLRCKFTFSSIIIIIVITIFDTFYNKNIKY